MANDSTLNSIKLTDTQKCLLRICRRVYADVEHDKLTCCAMENVFRPDRDFCWGNAGQTEPGYHNWKDRLEDPAEQNKGQRQKEMLDGSKKAKYISCTSYVNFYLRVEAACSRNCPGNDCSTQERR